MRSTPTRLLFRKKITAVFADGSSKMNLGIATVVRMLKGAPNVPVEVAADAAARELLAEPGRKRDRRLAQLRRIFFYFRPAGRYVGLSLIAAWLGGSYFRTSFDPMDQSVRSNGPVRMNDSVGIQPPWELATRAKMLTWWPSEDRHVEFNRHHRAPPPRCQRSEKEDRRANRTLAPKLHR